MFTSKKEHQISFDKDYILTDVDTREYAIITDAKIMQVMDELATQYNFEIVSYRLSNTHCKIFIYSDTKTLQKVALEFATILSKYIISLETI